MIDEIESMINPLSPEITIELDNSARLLASLQNQGVVLFKKLIAKPFAKEETSSFFFLLRNYLSYIDASAAIIKLSSCESVELLMRSMLEINLYIEYMLETNIENRISSYQVCYVIEKIKSYKRLDNNTEEGKAFISTCKKDDIAKNIDFPQVDSQELSSPLICMLNQEPYLSIKKEYDRVKKVKKKKPEWFELWNGPTNIQELFRLLRKDAIYEIYYRLWSSTVHQSGALRNISIENGKGGVKYLRDPKEIFGLCQTEVTLILELYTNIIKKLIPEYLIGFSKYYSENIQEGFLRLGRIKVSD